MEILRKFFEYSNVVVSSIVILGSVWWYIKLDSYHNVSVWECYATFNKDVFVPSYVPQNGYSDITAAFKNVCSHGMMVASWLIVSAIGALGVMQLLNLSEKTVKGIVLCQIALGFLSLAWLIHATILRFGHAGKVCSGDFVSKDMEEWGLPGPYIGKEGSF